MPQFRVGDVVQLKSGGPDMTVSHILPSGNMFCVWFDGSEKREETFPPEGLHLAETENGAMKVG
jgi:uncharacterized protein YodC (DUF2158 family)